MNSKNATTEAKPISILKKDSPLVIQFNEEMLKLYRVVGEQTKYWARRFLQKVKTQGGLPAAQDWLRPNVTHLSGLEKLAMLNRLELSFEFLVLSKPWSQLFTEVELQVARNRLLSVAGLSTHPLVIDALTEGTAFEIRLTVYERNPKARQMCIDHFGAKCSICNFDFFAQYGELGKDYIHVHHLELLSSNGHLHQVNPIKDLRPVCPNCHAMLHRQKPPISIENMQNIIKRHF